VKIILCSRDFEYGIGTYIFNTLKYYQNNSDIEKVLVIGPINDEIREVTKSLNKIILYSIADKNNKLANKQPFFSRNVRKNIISILKEEKYDLLHLHSPIICDGIDIPILWTIHGLRQTFLVQQKDSKKYSKSFKFIQKIYSRYDKNTLKHSKKLIFVSKNVMTKSIQILPDINKKSIYLPSPIDSKLFKKIKSNNFLKDINPENKSILLYVGRLEVSKGVDLLIDAFNKIENDKLLLLLIGNGPLSNLIQSNTRIKIIERVNNNQLPEIYSNSEIFILPSLSENSPMTILEAISCGLPVIANDTGDINIMIPSGNFIIGDITSSKLYEAIQLILKMPKQKISKIIEENRIFINKNYDPERHFNKLVEIYNEILQN